ncbi:MAG TPA: endolytic transglycosylase MltG [Candidatus Saccharimonadales bacterium]|nr:endolytic transglycosylase MltG [Candidatus Saccharimonadales bacterium]
MIYAQPNKRHWPKRLVFVLLVALLLVVVATAGVRYTYNANLKPVSTSEEIKLFTVDSGATVEEIANNLQNAKLIKSAWAFKLYVSSKEVRSDLQAGEYELQPRMSVAEIVSVLTHGKVATNLVTIIPGKRIDQIRESLMEYGFPEADVNTALDPATYAGNPALVDKPDAASLEGYLYPDSYQKTSSSTAQDIIESALLEMRKTLTPDLRAAFAKQGLSTYQALILASIVEREVPKDEDRTQVAQVFLTRMQIGMRLESDATRYYYDTYKNDGLPPAPISNVSKSSLQAVANPAKTDWIYFVSGDDGTTHFSHTLAEHESKVRQYCQENCSL